MTVLTEPRYGFQWNYATGDSGWGAAYNYTMRALGALLCAYLISDSVTTTPASPADGDTYWLPTGVTGTWAGNAGKIASYQEGTWEYYPTPAGLRAYIVSRAAFRYWSGTAWTAEGGSGGGVGTVVSVAGVSPDGTGNVPLIVANISGAAPLASPALTGAPTAPTQAALNRGLALANTKYVDDAISASLGIYDIPVFRYLLPSLPEPILSLVMVRPIKFSSGLPGSRATLKTATTGSLVLPLQQNGTGIGSLNFAAAATSGTFTFSADANFVAGDLFEMLPSASPDATAAGLHATFIGAR